MKLLLLYSCLLSILFQAFFASSSLSGDGGSLKGSKRGPPKPKKVASKSTNKKALAKTPSKEEEAGKSDKSKEVVVKKDEPKSMSEILPKPLIEIVVGYLRGTYSILVSTHDWLLTRRPEIAVDSARVYVITDSEGIKGLNHFYVSLKNDKHCCMEVGDPQWSVYSGFASSYDGRYAYFSHSYRISTDHGEHTEEGITWFTQGSELDGGFKLVMFDNENLSWGRLSRDGQTLFSYSNSRMDDVTRVYQIKEEAGKGPVAFIKFEFNGVPLAVSGKGNRVMVNNSEQLEIHDISKKTRKLICRVNVNIFLCSCALNENGSEAAFVDNHGLRIIEVDKIVGDNVEQPAIVTVKVPKASENINELVYSDENKLHVLHDEGSVSLFDPSTKAFILIETPQIGQKIDNWAVSPNADYYTTIQRVPKEEKDDGKLAFRTVVRRKCTNTEWMHFLG